MPSLAELINQSSAHAWLLIPSAVLLGGLHGLEPGHSKTMMVAFIVAVRGTVGQAIMLGLAATASHTLVVWVIALGGMYLWQGVDAKTFEPYFQLASAAIILGIALWMLWRTWRSRRAAKAAAGQSRGEYDHHGHAHGEDVRRIDTGHGVIAVEVFEDGVPPRWRVRSERGHAWKAGDVTIVTERPSGARRMFLLTQRSGYLESIEEVPKPHEFMVRVSLNHGGYTRDYDLSFIERCGHKHGHIHEELRGLELVTNGYQGARELAHANDIRHEFAGRNVTHWQIVAFGLTGGLIPCPAAITALLLCLQLEAFTLGFALVLCFSIGLAITLVTIGAAAALSVRHAANRWPWFSASARVAPYFSIFLIIAVSLYVGYTGWTGLAVQAAITPAIGG